MEQTSEDIVLSIQNISKSYLKEDGNKGSQFWALDDVSFDLKKGDILGVIGRNGAGKSTLLKVLSQITSPTSGTVEIRGRLTSILDIGTGFHPDLSGKENVFLSATLVGMSKKQIKEIYDEIVSFSGLEDFMNMPVKRYSSGMYLRLAFSVAFHSKIDILLLDEVLAVGDVDFRRKCYDRIRDLGKSGASIILVSHFLEPIVSFCNRCVLLDQGKVDGIGAPIDIVASYTEKVALDSGIKVNGTIGDGLNAPPRRGVNYLYELSDLNSPLVKINDFHIGKADRSDSISMDDDIIVSMSFDKLKSDTPLELTYSITDMNSIRVFLDSRWQRKENFKQNLDKGRYEMSCVIPGNLLNRGVYTLGLIISSDYETQVEIEKFANFNVTFDQSDRIAAMNTCVIRPYLDWSISAK